MYIAAERRNTKTGKWEALPDITYGGRNYALFALLAGIRNYQCLEPCFPPRELPTDCSAETYKAKFTELSPLDDGRITSWITLSELDSLGEDDSEGGFWEAFSTKYDETEFSHEVLSALHRAYNSNDNDPRGEVRLVFWFDDTENE